MSVKEETYHMTILAIEGAELPGDFQEQLELYRSKVDQEVTNERYYDSVPETLVNKVHDFANNFNREQTASGNEKFIQIYM